MIYDMYCISVYMQRIYYIIYYIIILYYFIIYKSVYENIK